MMLRTWLACMAIGVVTLGMVAGSACGQGILIVDHHHGPIPLPRPIHPPSPPIISYKIKELRIDARIQDQIARVQVTQSFVNTGSAQMEVSFCFPLPYDGAIDQMTFMVDGKEFDAKLLPADKARQIYEGYVRQNRDPALLEWIGTGMFKTSVFPVPPGAERKVTLSFSQLLRKQDRLTDFLYPLSTARFTSQPIESFALNVNVESKSKIKSVYSPTHPINIQRSDDHHATIVLQAQNSVPSAEFRLFYDTAASEVGASVISYRPSENEDGYFLLLASPEVKAADAKSPSKTVVFVLDRSGSMAGKKIDQAKEALKFVINNLREDDLFNIVVYDANIESFKPELQRYNEQIRSEALGYIEGIYPGGSTNISGALSTALGMIQDGSRPNFVVFLTDGLPTAGEKNELKINQLTKQANAHRARVVSFGVGYDVNSRLLDRLSRDNFGQSEFVRPDEDIEEHVSHLYQRMSQPVMTDVQLTVDVEGLTTEQGGAVNRVYPKQLLDLFAGDQMVVVGRYKVAGQAKVTIAGRVAQEQCSLDFPAELIAHSTDQSFAFVEKLWALRRVGEIIDDLDLNGKNQELIDELVALSTKHGILTPYTSFLADENAAISDLANVQLNRSLTTSNLGSLSIAAGREGVAQRAGKKALQEALMPSADSFGGGYGSGGGMGGPGSVAAAAPAAAGGYGSAGAVYLDAATDKPVQVNTVVSVGGQTLFKRGQRWIADNAKDVDPDRDQAKLVQVKRFSDAYFKLIADNTVDENTILARQQDGEQLIIKLRGQAYMID